jgi:uncharacterized protein (DUF924 family)
MATATGAFQPAPDAAVCSPAEVLAFWFGEPAVTSPRPEWFRKDATFDAHIVQRFGATIAAALATGLPAWGSEPLTSLARIVVLDQFTRNAFRETPRAFAGDAQALAAARALVASGAHLQLQPLQRWFAYLPFEHAEDAGMQAESMRLFDALALQHPDLADARLWAHKHQQVIHRFGRYPHRNLVLGRLSTPEEAAFLQEPGSSF